MGRLRSGEKSRKEGRVRSLLGRHGFGLRESEIADELGWQRRTVNNYLRDLKQRGCAYKDGRCWFADD